MREGVSAFEDDMVFRGRERQHIGASQPLKADTVMEGRVLPKPSDPVRHQNGPNRPQVVQVSQSTLRRDSLERNPVAHRPDTRRRTSLDMFDRGTCLQTYKTSNS